MRYEKAKSTKPHFSFLISHFSDPVWVALAHGHNLYHADSRRADYGWTDEVAPVIQMATLWRHALNADRTPGRIASGGDRPVGTASWCS